MKELKRKGIRKKKTGNGKQKKKEKKIIKSK